MSGVSTLDSHARRQRWPRLDRLEREFLFRIAADRSPQCLGVIGVDPGVVPGAAYRYIELPAIDQLGAAQRIDVDNYPVDRGALGRVRG